MAESILPDDPFLQQALIGQESGGDPNAISYDKYGKPVAYGLTQITIPTWKTFAKPEESLKNPDDQKKVGLRILSNYYDKVGGDIELGLAAYNAGPQRVKDAQEAAGATSFEDIKSFLPPQARDYVPSVLARYKKLKGSQPETIEEEEDAPVTDDSFQASTAPQALNVPPFDGDPNSLDAFSHEARYLVTSPEFIGQTPKKKVAAIAQLYNQRDWDAEVTDKVKDLSTIAWKSATPEELPSLQEIIGTPPLIEKQTDPKEVDAQLEGWKVSKIQELRENRISPALFGNQLDEYFNFVTDREKQAYTARNRNIAEWGLNRAGNYVRLGAQGAAGVLTSVAAAPIRLGGAPFGVGQETADTIESAPARTSEYFLGPMANDFLYYTDKDGYPVQNPDGTFKTHWQASIAEGIGGIAGIIGTLGVGTVAGVSSKVLSAAAIGTNTLTMANASFRDVYAKTNSLSAAYGAAAFSIPAGAISSIGELGIISGAFRPSLKSFTLYDQARVFAQSAGKNAFINSTTNAAGDVVQQFGETLQTGEAFDPSRTGQVAVIGAIGGGLAGAGVDLLSARKTLAKNDQLRYQYLTQSQKDIADFRNGIASQKTVTTPSQYFTDGDKALFGVEATSNPDGTTTLTKKTSGVNTNPVVAGDLDSLSKAIKDIYTPNEVLSLGKEHAELASKGVRDSKDQARMDFLGGVLVEANKPEYLNNLKTLEERFSGVLSLQPDAQHIYYDNASGKWASTEHDLKFDNVKEMLFPDEVTPKFYKQDLSDVSGIPIIDEDVVTPSIQEAQKTLTDHETSIGSLNAEILNLKKESTAIDEGLLPIKNQQEIGRLAEQQEKLRQQIRDTEGRIPQLQREKNDILVKQEAVTAIKRQLLNEKDKVLRARLVKRKSKLNVEIEDLQNRVKRYNEQTEQLRGLREKDASLEARLSQFPQREVVQQARARQREIGVNESKIRNRITELKQRTPGLKKELTDRGEVLKKLESTRKKGLGEYDPNTKEIILPKSPDPETKVEVLAHETAHAIQDNISLPEDVTSAVKSVISKMQDQGAVATPKELGQEFFLPNISKNIKYEADLPVAKMTKASKEKLFTKVFTPREFMANQIAALMLERSGKSIGNYKILPEVRALLEDTRLPSLEQRKASVEAPAPEPELIPARNESEVPTSPRDAPVEEVSASSVPEETQVPENTSEPLTSEAPSIPESTSPSRGSGEPLEPLSAFRTGEQREMALSKTIREGAPGYPKQVYDAVSRVRGIAEADAYVNSHNITETENMVSDLGNSLDPIARVLLADAIWTKRKLEFINDPTESNRIKSEEAGYETSRFKSIGAQMMAVGIRYRGTQNFAQYIGELAEAFRKAGVKEPKFTDLQLKELKAAYEKAQHVPAGHLRNSYVQKLHNDALRTQKISPKDFWESYAKNAMQTNLLSGIGTPMINGVSGGWMGPFFTALSHPIVGRGLVWRSMIESIRSGVPWAQAKVVLEGKTAQAFFGGLYEPKGLDIKDTSSIPRAVASLQNKFGRGVFKVLGATDAFMRTVSGDGYIAYKQYKVLKEKYGNDPAKFTSEVSKIMISRDDINSAISIAEKEGLDAGLQLTPADKAVRAYEILRTRDIDNSIITEAGDWANSTSLRGEIANPALQILHRALYSPQLWDKHPIGRGVRNVLFPFGRAMISLSDFALDFVPGNIAVAKAGKWAFNKFDYKQITEPRNAALEHRLVKGQIVGTTLAATFLGLARAGVIQITGDPEQVLDRGGEGDSTGKKAKSRAQFKEFEQKGEAPFTVYFPKLDAGFSYKDFPGLNAIFYGLYQMNKALDGGQSIPAATIPFAKNALWNALPLVGAGTLNSPYVKLVTDIMDPEVTEDKIYKALKKASVSASKMALPGSSLLRDVKNIYDSTPEETNQSQAMQMMANIPVISELSGSKPALNRFGQPIERTWLETVPGVGRIIEEKKVPTDPTMYQLYLKGIVIPELQSKVKIDKGDFGSERLQEQYTKTREDRLGSAYAKVLTPDEWYDFVLATGPYIKTASKQILTSNLPADRAQERLLEKVKAIEDQAMKRYIRTGKFTLN